MSHPLDNPFRKRTPPTKSEAGVIGSLLGDAAQTAFEAVGGSDKIDDEYFLDEGLGESGKRLQQEADDALERDGKWTRKRYVMWAESFGKDEEWIDEHFVFQKDDTTITPKHIDLNGKGLTELPKGWVKVEGYCNLSNNQLTTLNGAPEIVGDSFICHSNQLTSLIGAPESVGSNFICHNNQLTSLTGAPESVGGYFSCSGNQLTSLTGAPRSVGGDFFCDENQLTSLTGAPERVGNDFFCDHNKLTSLDELPEYIGKNIYARNNYFTPEALKRARAKWGDKLDLTN